MVARRMQLPAASFAEFGTLLRVLRRRARLTQRDLGIGVGYWGTAGPPGSGTAGAGPGGPAPEPDGSLLALERCAVTACVALASGDRATAARQAAEMGRRAAVNGFALEARAARRICAAVGAGAADETDAEAAPDAARYPRLIWVSDETSGLDLPVRDASLTQS